MSNSQQFGNRFHAVALHGHKYGSRHVWHLLDLCSITRPALLTRYLDRSVWPIVSSWILSPGRILFDPNLTVNRSEGYVNQDQSHDLWPCKSMSWHWLEIVLMLVSWSPPYPFRFEFNSQLLWRLRKSRPITWIVAVACPWVDRASR